MALDETITKLGESIIALVDNKVSKSGADVELSNLTSTGKSQYNPFCINTGVTDDNGNPACITVDDNILTTSGTFTCSGADGTIYEISDVLTLDISSYNDGDYNIFINPDVPELYLMQNTIYTGTSMPSGAVKYDYLLNISKIPYTLDEKTDDGVEPCIASHAVWAGVLTKTGGGVVTLNQYNKSTESSSTLVIETYVNGTSWYRIWSDGWCEQGAMDSTLGSDKNRTITLLIPFATTEYTITSGTCGTRQSSGTGSDRLWYINNESTFTSYQDSQEDKGYAWIARGLIS